MQTQKETFVTTGVQTYSSTLCGNSTIHKPKVDILFVVDNSTSLNPVYASEDLKNSIANVVSNVSNNFNYHAFVVPLLAYAGESQQLVVSDMDGLGAGAPTPVALDNVNVEQYLNNTQPGGAELGFQRVKNIINANIVNGVFRKEVHTLVVMLTNGDDTDNVYDQYGNMIATNYSQRLAEMKLFTKKSGDTTLEALTFRFFSVVAHTSCQYGFIKGTRYMQMSADMYAYSEATDQAGNAQPDSYDLCTGSITNVFNSIASVLPTTVVNHTYNYWPAKITDNPVIDFNPNVINVRKVTSSGIVEIPESMTNGYQFIPSHMASHNIKKFPIVSTNYPAESLSGFFIQLNGSAKVASPECLAVQIQDPQEFYGYIVIGNNPNLSETIIKKNGVVINQYSGSGNGWSFESFSPSQNKRITGPNDYTPHPNGVYETGYVFKFHGNSTYTNEDIIEIEFKQIGI
ncbi:hypothetical protein N9B72_01135 [Bacteriovoracaceae bacterium]|nr:hypothetical protein [Bacteriovoracaceae bacterium]